MLTSEVMFELELRRAQSFDVLIAEGKKKKGNGLKLFFFQKRSQIILTKTKRLACNGSINFRVDMRWPQKCLNSAAAKMWMIY